jgi:hypothetical protein
MRDKGMSSKEASREETPQNLIFKFIKDMAFEVMELWLSKLT